VPWRSGADDPAWMDASAEWPAIERTLASAPLAAIVVEPLLQAAGGMRPVSPDLLTRLRAWGTANGVFVIHDEIASGFGRCSEWLASHTAPNAQPDIVVLGKGLTAGSLPLAAVLTTNAIHDLFLGASPRDRAFLHSNTHAGNALAVAAALGAIDAMSADNGSLFGAAANAGRLMRQGLQLIADRADVGDMQIVNVRGVGCMAACDLVAADGSALDPAARTGWRVFREAMARGALLRPLGDTLYLFPPLTITEAEISFALRVLRESVEAVAASTAG
jgi:adenosylmethionine-8-amino-7-oxononanoate aminotransferase